MPAYIPWSGSPSAPTRTPSSPESILQTPSPSSIRDAVQDSPLPTATTSYIPWPGAPITSTSSYIAWPGASTPSASPAPRDKIAHSPPTRRPRRSNIGKHSEPAPLSNIRPPRVRREISEPATNPEKRPKNLTPGQVAKFAIDDFQDPSGGFRAKPSNKLLLWQSFCIELGLCQPESNPLPSFSNLSISDPPSPPPEDKLPTLPSSCRRCYLLLQEAHVNLIDYLGDRGDNIDSFEFRSYHYLLFPTEEAVAEYSRVHKKVANGAQWGDEWLKPLLKKVYHPPREA